MQSATVSMKQTRCSLSTLLAYFSSKFLWLQQNKKTVNSIHTWRKIYGAAESQLC